MSHRRPPLRRRSRPSSRSGWRRPARGTPSAIDPPGGRHQCLPGRPDDRLQHLHGAEDRLGRGRLAHRRRPGLQHHEGARVEALDRRERRDAGPRERSGLARRHRRRPPWRTWWARCAVRASSGCSARGRPSEPRSQGPPPITRSGRATMMARGAIALPCRAWPGAPGPRRALAGRGGLRCPGGRHGGRRRGPRHQRCGATAHTAGRSEPTPHGSQGSPGVVAASRGDVGRPSTSWCLQRTRCGPRSRRCRDRSRRQRRRRLDRCCRPSRRCRRRSWPSSPRSSL